MVGDVIPGSPAAAAQLHKGDVILKFDGHDVKNFPTLRHLVSQAEVGKKIDLEISRNGKPIKVTTAIKEQPANYGMIGSVPQPDQPDQSQPPNDQGETNGPLAGIEVGELTPALVQQLDLPGNVRGVVVTKVDPSASNGELQQGDVIEEVNQQPVHSVSEFQKMVNALDPNENQVLSVCRHRTRSFVVVRPQ